MVTMQVIRYALEQVADEMGYTLVRTARSPIIKEIKDVTCAIFDDEGNTTAQAHHAPMLLTGFELTMKELRKRFALEDLEEGDVIVSNDPYMGGQHIMDIQTFAPVHFDGEVVSFVGSIGHQSDMGGTAPGGVAGGMTEIFQEGLRLPMVKLYEAYEENDDVMAIIRSNIRVPEKTVEDIKAQVASNYVGIKKVREVYGKYGVDVVHDCIRMLLDYSESRLRRGLRALPDGTYSGRAFIDNDGVTDERIPIQVNITIDDDTAKVGFEGTSEQVRGNVNCPIATTHAAVFYTMIAVADPHVPPNSGCYRPVTIEAEEGLVVNPRPPGAVAARTNCSQKIVEAMLMALSEAAPDRVMAGSHGQITTCGFSGFRDGKRWVYTDIQGGGAGALPTKDGKDGQDSHLARFMNTPVEAIELEYPVRIEMYEFIPDSGGAGRWRGALGFRRDIRFLVDGVSFARYGDTQKTAPFGLFGGKEGSKGLFVLNPGPEEERIKAKGMSFLRKGDVVSLRLPGGGGYGDPLERDLSLVEKDLRDGKVTPEAAKTLYGVVVSADGRSLRMDESRRAREKARSDG
jgi:N-methylhydantoinase B